MFHVFSKYGTNLCRNAYRNMKHTYNIDHNTIRLIVSAGGKKYRKGTGLSVSPSLWNQKAKSLRAKCKDERVWNMLRMIESRMVEAESKDMNPEVAIVYAITGDVSFAPGKRPTFWEYFKAWGERPSPVQRQRRLYPNIVSKLMGTKDDWEQIDSAYYFRLCRAMDDYGCSINYKGAIISKLKVVMNEGYKLKYHKNEDFRQFKRMSEVPETIALSSDELDRLWACKDLTQMESKARDLFMIGVYSVSRWEDYSRMSMANIANGMLNYEQLKTGKTVILPVSPRLLECLERNGGVAPSLSQQKFNEAIKRACKKIGMTERLHVSRSRGSGRVSESKERWELVSSHTARRTGATLLYLSGVPAKRVMLCTGHTTERVFLSYIKVSREENARMLAGNAFFQ